jgi:hypothetical protein
MSQAGPLSDPLVKDSDRDKPAPNGTAVIED